MIEAFIDELRKALPPKPIGSYLESSKNRNEHLVYYVKDMLETFDWYKIVYYAYTE